MAPRYGDFGGPFPLRSTAQAPASAVPDRRLSRLRVTDAAFFGLRVAPIHDVP